MKIHKVKTYLWWRTRLLLTFAKFTQKNKNDFGASYFSNSPTPSEIHPELVKNIF